MERMLMEGRTIKSIIPAVDLNTAANTGLRVDMQNVKKVTFLFDVKAGSTPNSHTFAFKQHTVASAGSPAALLVDNPYFHKVDTATVFTKVDSTGTKVSSLDLDVLVGDLKFMVAFEVNGEDLTDGYRYVSMDLTQAGGSQFGACIAIVEHNMKPAYAQAV